MQNAELLKFYECMYVVEENLMYGVYPTRQKGLPSFLGLMLYADGRRGYNVFRNRKCFVGTIIQFDRHYICFSK